MTSFLQSPKRSAQLEGHSFQHSQADNYVRFLCAVSMLRNSGEGYADNTGFLFQLGEQIDMERRMAVIEDNQPFAFVSDFSNGPRHGHSIRKTKVRAAA